MAICVLLPSGIPTALVPLGKAMHQIGRNWRAYFYDTVAAYRSILMSNHPRLATPRRLPFYHLKRYHPSRWLTALSAWLLRGLLGLRVRSPHPQPGFILPTTILMLLVISLAVGAITLRSFERTKQVATATEQRVVYNAATPAIERAKAKLEFLFSRRRDPRLPSGFPSEAQFMGMLTNDERSYDGLVVPQLLITNSDGNVVDPYTFPDEENTAATVLNLSNTLDIDGNGLADRLDIDGDGNPDNAWAYRTDLDDDGVDDATVAYSIIFATPANAADMENASDAAVITRANALQVRHGPLSAGNTATGACQVGDAGADPIEEGWFRDSNNTAILRKNFQVNALVLPDAADGTVSAIEFHQDRQLAQGNKWGAWFRNDLEIFPGPQFNWNGAMHTEGNLIVGGSAFDSFLVSAPTSCIYSRESSEITVTNIEADSDRNIPDFQGQILSGTTNKNSFEGSSEFHLYGLTPIITGDDKVLLDSSRDSVSRTTPKPIDYALDPVRLLTEDVSVARGTADPSAFRATDWNANDKPFVEEARIYNQAESTPYLDDFFRADNRYGPKPTYAGRTIPTNIGTPIAGDLMDGVQLPDYELINTDDADARKVGLDGYWERRAQREGMRLIVGQRLDLGDIKGWGLDLNDDGELTDTVDADGNGFADEREAEPLYTASSCPTTRCHETLQRRKLYDNLGAVQAMAVYHRSHANGTFPAACYAITAHPGTAATIKASRTFSASPSNGTLPKVDFMNAEGTDGWEFAPPAGVTTEADFANAIAANQPLGTALRNLAHLAGDPKGGAPSFAPVQDDDVHPQPNLTMFGDFSMLRRILAMLDGGSAADGNPTGETVAYADLSPADQATLHTAACTIGMLAYNAENAIDQAKTAAKALSNLTSTGEAFASLMDANSNNGDLVEIYVTQKLDNGDPNPYYTGAYPTAKKFYDNYVDPDPNSLIIDPASPVSNPKYLCAPTGSGLPLTAKGVYDTGGWEYVCDMPDLANTFTLDQFIIALSLMPSISYAEARAFGDLAKSLLVGYQLLRDRAQGFNNLHLPNVLDNTSVIDWDLTTGYTETTIMARTGAEGVSLRTGCDPNLFGPMTGGGLSSGDGASKRRAIALSVAVCGESLQIRYPSLYYIMPMRNHDHRGKNFTAPERIYDDQPTLEEYVNDRYIFDPTTAQTGVNNGYVYKVINDGDGNGVENDTDNGVQTIALTPRKLDLSDWVLPTATTGINEIYKADGTVLGSVPWLDKGVFNSREMMSTRVLDIDWDLLDDSTGDLGTDINGNPDHWLPNSGIVYAAREDTVREDAIVRPIGTGATWVICGDNEVLADPSNSNNARCRMKADPANPQDPPLSATNLMSPKAVDYYPDPMRQPNGFRLRNGAELARDDDNQRGLSFIADAPVYIQGDFNLHQTVGCGEAESCRLEEFTTKLPTGSPYTTAQFYDNRTILDSRFATADKDT